MEEKREILVYLAPHQDDELTNLGVDLLRETAAGKEVWCLLCTDGSSSAVRKDLENGKECLLHPGRHVFSMDRAAFSRARDREWRESLLALGLSSERAVIAPERAVDGELTREKAKEIVLDFLTSHPAVSVTLKTILPVKDRPQHPDHANLGLAAEDLFREGKADALELFYEPILCMERRPGEEGLIRIEPGNGEERSRILKAAAAYAKWDPEEGFFAIGYHSVKNEFDAFTADPHCLKKRMGRDAR